MKPPHKTLADTPFRQRWPDRYSLKAQILCPVVPPEKGRAEIKLETAVPSSVVTLLVLFAGFPIETDDAQKKLLEEELALVVAKAIARTKFAKDVKEAGNKKNGTAPPMESGRENWKKAP